MIVKGLVFLFILGIGVWIFIMWKEAKEEARDFEEYEHFLD